MARMKWNEGWIGMVGKGFMGGGAETGANTCICPIQCKDITERGDEPLLTSATREMIDLLKKKVFAGQFRAYISS